MLKYYMFCGTPAETWIRQCINSTLNNDYYLNNNVISSELPSKFSFSPFVIPFSILRYLIRILSRLPTSVSTKKTAP